MKIILENIRVFAGRHEIPLKPLTIVTGENSSGKSTLLATIAAIYNPGSFPLRPDFNVPPFNLGSYDTVATETPTSERVEKVTLGLVDNFGWLDSYMDYQDNEASRASAEYVSDAGQPALKSLAITNKEIDLELGFTFSANKDITIHYCLKGRRQNRTIERKLKASRKDLLRVIDFRDFLLDSLIRFREELGQDQDYDYLFNVVMRSFSALPPRVAVSVAPIRSKPRRTYDWIAIDYQPEGDHIPFLLARLWNESDPVDKETVLEALTTFGKDSGMFDAIQPKAYGGNPGDPFQIQVTAGGKTSNLIDVGYGISQSLPIIVQTVLSQERNILLLQQPEVHLHPRAQAALGSFFARTVAGREQTMVIETHSDYIVDRIRQEVAKGTIDKSEVQILFLEKDKEVGTSTIHRIQLDANGNVVDPPPCYREFFLHEELNLLTRTSS